MVYRLAVLVQLLMGDIPERRFVMTSIDMNFFLVNSVKIPL